jgi:hypothetical protein
MSRWNEREIARKLAERDELEPPAGLLEKIKSEIPPMIPAGTGEPEIDRQPSMPPRQRWLIAASLVATVGAGLFALHLRMEETPPVEENARAAAGLRQPAPPQVFFPPPPPSIPAPRAFAQPLAKPREVPAPKRLSAKDEEQLKALGYVGPQAERKSEGGAPGGIVGGAAPAAPVPAPPAAPTPSAVPAPPAEAQPRDDQLEVHAESPLLDERRAGKELEKTPAARDPWAVLQSAPGVVTDRINVGGNESGQQSLYTGPGTADQPQARSKAAGAHLVWTAPSPRIVTIEMDAGTASYDRASRSIAAGKLPDPAAVRVGEVLNAFDTGGAPLAEGAATPFVQGPRYRLLRINRSGISPVRVSFNPSTVIRYRLVGSGAAALYEIELKSNVSRPEEIIGVLHLGNGGTAVTLSQLASSWDQASPSFRLAALAAEFAEILKSPAVDASALSRLSEEIGKLPKSAKAAELGEVVGRAARVSMPGG